LACKGTQRVCLDTIRPPSGRVELERNGLKRSAALQGARGVKAIFTSGGQTRGDIM
jgi:hypothetical protein